MLTWLIVSILGSPFPGHVSIDWQMTYDQGSTEKIHGMEIKKDNASLVVVGENSEASVDIHVLQLSKNDGEIQWSQLCDNEGNDDVGSDVAIAPNGTIFVGGTSTVGTDPQLYYVILTPEGSIMHKVQVSTIGFWGEPALDCRHQDSCYVATWRRTASTPDSRMYIVREDGARTRLIDNGFDRYTSVSLDSEGYIYLASSTAALTKLEAGGPGVLGLWRTEFEEGDASTRGWQCRVAPSSDIFLCGEQYRQGTATDFLLLKWDSAGTLLWPSGIYYDLGHEDYCRDLAVDGISDCYLAGWQVRGEEEDVALVKTDSAGNLLWSWVYEQEGDQEIEAIEVDDEGYIYLAGSHHNGENWDMLVMQVRQPLTISGRITDTVGASMSGVPVKLSGDTTVEVVSDTDGFYSIEVYNGGNYVVTPQLGGWAFEPSSYSYNPLAHRELNQNFSGEYTAIAEPDTPVTPATHPTLEVTTSTIHYAIPHDQRGIISIFDASGQLIEKVEVVGIGSLGFPDLASGVYVIRLDAGHSVLTEKVIISR